MEGGTKRRSGVQRSRSWYLPDTRKARLAGRDEQANSVCHHDSITPLIYANDQEDTMEKKKRFLRPSSFMKRRSSAKLNVKSSENTKNCLDSDIAAGSQLSNERNDVFEQCKRLKTELETSNDKVDQYQMEVELLQAQLRSVYRKELKANENVPTVNTDCDSDVSLNAVTKAEDIRPDIRYRACSDGECDPSEHHTRPCKECEKLLLTRVSALVEAINLRRYVLQLNKMTEKGENGTETFLSENERKLTKTLAEKELVARQLKSVIRERDKILLERDRALEEWEKAASKWETTLDQLDTLMIQQNDAKERDCKTINHFKGIITQLETTLREKERANQDFQEQCTKMEEQLSQSKKEAKDFTNEHDVILKANFNIAQELRRVNSELNECRVKCAELASSVGKAETLLERNKANNEHIVKQWKYAVKEKKKLQREIPGIVQSRDEAIQRNLSTLSQLDRVREERDKLSRRLKDMDGNGNMSDVSDIHCSLAGCQFCTDSASSTNGKTLNYEEINVCIPKTAMSEASFSLESAIIEGHNTIMITSLDEFLVKHHNLLKYDDVVVVNQQSVVGADASIVKKLMTECETDVSLTLRRYKAPCEITFEIEVPIPKKSKMGCGIHWGVYIKDLTPADQANKLDNLETGDYVNMINGKNLTKILSSALDKYTKKGDKMNIEVSRKLSPTVLKCPCHYTAMRKLKILLRDKYPNRDSVISVESIQSLGASSISSIPSYVSSIDSASICSPTASESEGYFKMDRKTPEVFTIDSGVPPTIAEECSTDDNIFHSRSGRVRSLSHLGKPKHSKKDSLTRAQSLTHSLNAENVRARSMSRSSGPFCSNGSIASVKQLRPVTPVRSVMPAVFTVPVSRERNRVIRLEKRSGETLGLKINGGNCVGIYVTGFWKQSLAEEAGVRVGDRVLQLNSYSLSQVTLDYATRIVRMLKTCNYIRMEVQNYANVDDVLKEGTLDSLYIRARISHKANLSTELSYEIGDKLRVINTRANYDPQKETWSWFAVRERLGENGGKEEGFIPAMNYSPDLNEPISPAKSISSARESEGDDGMLSDDSVRNKYNYAKRNSADSRRSILLRRYRGSKRRSSIESLGSETDSQYENKISGFYEILQEKQV